MHSHENTDGGKNLWQINTPFIVPSQVNTDEMIRLSSNLTSPGVLSHVDYANLINSSNSLLSSSSSTTRSHVNSASRVSDEISSSNMSSVENTIAIDSMKIKNDELINHRKLHLSLGGNPLLCDCNIRYLLQVSFF